MHLFVVKYVNSVLQCGLAKGNYGRGEGILHLIQRIPVHLILFILIIWDLLWEVFVRTLLVLVYSFTKYVITKPTRTLKLRETVVKLREIFENMDTQGELLEILAQLSLARSLENL